MGRAVPRIPHRALRMSSCMGPCPQAVIELVKTEAGPCIRLNSPKALVRIRKHPSSLASPLEGLFECISKAAREKDGFVRESTIL